APSIAVVMEVPRPDVKTRQASRVRATYNAAGDLRLYGTQSRAATAAARCDAQPPPDFPTTPRRKAAHDLLRCHRSLRHRAALPLPRPAADRRMLPTRPASPAGPETHRKRPPAGGSADAIRSWRTIWKSRPPRWRAHPCPEAKRWRAAPFRS